MTSSTQGLTSFIKETCLIWLWFSKCISFIQKLIALGLNLMTKMFCDAHVLITTIKESTYATLFVMKPFKNIINK